MVYVVIFGLTNLLAFSQKDLISNANTLFNEKRFGEAIPLYNKIYEAKKDRVILLKLADANYLNENYPQARKYYSKYFNDSVYEHIPQFGYYVRSCRLSGKISEAVQLYQKLYNVTQADSSKRMLEIYKLYVDSSAWVHSYNLDSNYKCVTIDASESLDTLATPMFYSWAFDDGKTSQGLIVEHCFKETGIHHVVLNIIDKRTGLTRNRDTSLTLLVENPPIKFTVPEIGRRYFYLEFNVDRTSLPDFEIVDYLWDMGNGEINNGKSIKHKYNNGGDYQIKLTVIAKNKLSGAYKLFSANKKFTVLENYEVPSKKFSDSLDGGK
ncbi:PKD domain-containing protein [Aurantibacillus circumpalustris]|uniref:PKD domain-containing protein n=1 Tax=Aurantibacillus circumpalustris TaxID=3036359 RepID=UPI00295B963C|nr:PKD domain-containing protein [Aurantibacillus circumpalustris]